MKLYSYTQPYLRNNVLVFDITRADRFLFWDYWSIVDTQFWESEEITKLIVSNFNLANILKNA